MSRFTRLLIIGLVSVSILVVGGGSAAFGAVRKVAMGVAMNNGRTVAAVDAFTQSVGRKPAIWTIWSDWGDLNPNSQASRDFPTAMATQLQQRGIVPMIIWEPINPASQSDCTNWSNAAINRGDHDDYIRQWAQAAKDFGGRIILRFAHEMNLSVFIWGLNRCTNTGATIKTMWQRVWNIFRGPDGVGATNVKFLWSVSGAGYLKAVYPGNNYVDYMGLSAFNWARHTPAGSWDAWRSMVKAFGTTMPALLNLSTKPIIAAEVASAHDPTCSTCSKPAWITNGYPAVRTKWPRVKAIVYLNVDLSAQGHPDWSLTTPPEALQAYSGVAARVIFQGTIP